VYDACDDLLEKCLIDMATGYVIEEHNRGCTADDQIVHVHSDEVNTDSIELFESHGHKEFRSHTVSGREDHRFSIPRQVELYAACKTAYVSYSL